jgi:uncharacterized membrane protein YadS
MSRAPTNPGTSGAPAVVGAAEQNPSESTGGAVAGLIIVLLLATITRFLQKGVLDAAAGTSFNGIARAIEYPVYAIVLGFVGNAVLTVSGVYRRLTSGFRTEFFIKTGLVLLGSTVLLDVIVRAAAPAIVQAFLVVTSVFFFTWWLGGKLGLDDRLRALLSSAVSICGVSAAIAAAGAVEAKREQLAYTASLVILFALPSIFLLPWLANAFGLSGVVAGAWIGGNIDTTAAVAAAGAIMGEDALQIATIVKSAQNVLMGVVAVALTAYFTMRAGGAATGGKSVAATLWERFPKFVLGFLLASVIATVVKNSLGLAPELVSARLATATSLREWFLIAAFVSIGLEFRIDSIREAGWRPVLVFGSAAVMNLTIGLIAAMLLFRGFSIG